MANKLPWDRRGLVLCPVPDCADGTRVIQVSSARYTCGFETIAKTCETCCGSGLKPPTPADAKMAAAGGDR